MSIIGPSSRKSSSPRPGGRGNLEDVLHIEELESQAAGRVEYHVVTPPGWTAGERLPLVLMLHGANSSAASLDAQRAVLDELWAAGDLPRAVVGCVSTPTEGGFYLDWPGAGRGWATLAAREFPAELARRFGADLNRIALTGGSMGGYGALRIAFADPGRFAAVATVEPAVFPGESADQVGPRNTLGVLAQLRAAMQDADPAAGYAGSHVVTGLRARADEIRASGLAIMIECGDADAFSLQDGAEYLHRVLWDLDISHEYHLRQGVDHVGPPMAGRQRDALLFVGRALARQHEASQDYGTAVAAEFRDWLAAGAAGPPPPVDFSSPAGPAVLRLMTEPERQAAIARDPAAGRRFGALPAG
jgi:S-formylglutathione hydrolase